MHVYSRSLSQGRNRQKGIKLPILKQKLYSPKTLMKITLHKRLYLTDTFQSCHLFMSWTFGLFTCLISRRWSMARSWSTLFGLSLNLLKFIIRSSSDSFSAWQKLVTVGINAPPEWQTFSFCYFLWFSLSNRRFLPPGVGLTGSSRPQVISSYLSGLWFPSPSPDHFSSSLWTSLAMSLLVFCVSPQTR